MAIPPSDRSYLVIPIPSTYQEAPAGPYTSKELMYLADHPDRVVDEARILATPRDILNEAVWDGTFSDRAVTLAAFRGNFAMCKALVKAGVNLDARGRFGTALICAVTTGQLEICKILINAGADITSTDSTPPGKNALQVAQHLVLLLGSNPHERGMDRRRAIVQAIIEEYTRLGLRVPRAADTDSCCCTLL